MIQDSEIILIKTKLNKHMSTKTKNPNALKFGKIEININVGNTDPYVPSVASDFLDHEDILKTLSIAIRDNMPALLIGESGTGKTSAIRFLAHQTNNGLRRVSLNGGTTADELVGRNMFNDKGTYWIDGVLTEAMRKGQWIVLDEINAALPEVLFVLQPLLDDDGYIVLNEKNDKEIIKKHPDFRIFATMNPSEDYEGTKNMNKALLSRFPICIHADFPPEKVETEIVKYHLGDAIAQSELTKKLIELANKTRSDKEIAATGVTYAINTRDVLNTLRLSENMDPLEAFSLAFKNKLMKEDRSALDKIARLILPSNKKKTAIRTPLMNANELKIGETYVFDADLHNVLIGLTDNEDDHNQVLKEGIEPIMAADREDAIKGEEFIIESVFWSEAEEATTDEQTTMGDKIASAIQMMSGANKGKKGFIMHHKDLDNTEEIIKSICELK